jgi:succinate dehydrogenase/fumarate reductase flavoprotein subunit
MNGFEIIILIGLVVAIAAGIGYYMTKGQPSLKEMTEDYHNNEEVQEVVELAKELYNKDLRPIVAKKAPKEVKETKSEFPIEQPAKKKRKYYPKKKKQGDN